MDFIIDDVIEEGARDIAREVSKKCWCNRCFLVKCWLIRCVFHRKPIKSKKHFLPLTKWMICARIPYSWLCVWARPSLRSWCNIAKKLALKEGHAHGVLQSLEINFIVICLHQIVRTIAEIQMWVCLLNSWFPFLFTLFFFQNCMLNYISCFCLRYESPCLYSFIFPFWAVHFHTIN